MAPVSMNRLPVLPLQLTLLLLFWSVPARMFIWPEVATTALVPLIIQMSAPGLVPGAGAAEVVQSPS